MKIKTLLATLLLTMNLSALTMGEVPKHVIIQGEDGGLVDGNKAWDSKTLQGNVFVMFYVDPDEKDANEHYTKALKKFKKENNLHFQSIAIVNLAATWKPNVIIEKILASKQKEFPDTIYVKDKKSVLVKAWDIKDDASDILIFDKNGKVIFYKAGSMSDEDMKKSFQLIKGNLANG
jgi:predicted transcriptional regulator